jgi:hypothetical protein
MTLTLRTSPTGDGNALADVAFADAYFTERGITAWTGASKESWLIQATDYMDGRFGLRWTDDVLDGTSDFPLVDGGSVPVKMARACCEYALRAISGPLAPDPVVDGSGARVVMTRKKLGPMEKEFQIVGPNVTPSTFKSYPAADMLLKGMLKPVSNRTYR